MCANQYVVNATTRFNRLWIYELVKKAFREKQLPAFIPGEFTPNDRKSVMAMLTKDNLPVGSSLDPVDKHGLWFYHRQNKRFRKYK